MTTVQLNCEICGVFFTRRASEHRRNLLYNRKTFCSKKCLGKANTKNLDNVKRYDISKHSSNRKNSNSPFKHYLRCILSRAKTRNKECSISIDYLRFIWEQQCGICPISGIKLELKNNSSQKLKVEHASVDRIDNDRGYVEGNIRFVSIMANYARHKFSDSELIEFCKKVSSYN